MDQNPSSQGPSRLFLATLLTLNGVSLAMLGFPHIESFIPPLIIFACIAFRRLTFTGIAAALFCLALLLSLREDANLHAGLTLIALAWLTRHQGTAKIYVAAALCAVATALISLSAQRLEIAGGGGSLSNIYLGHPALSSLHLSLVLHRLLYWASARAYISLPLILLAAAATLWRSKDLAAGALLGVPWLILSMVAVSPMAGDLWGYYAFPLVIPLFWPLFVRSFNPLPHASNASGPARLLWLQLAMGSISLLCFVLAGVLPGIGHGGSFDRAPWRHLLPPSPDQIIRTQVGISTAENNPRFSHTILDDGAAALTLDTAKPGQFTLGLVPTGLNLATANAFLRFDQPLTYAAATEGAINKQFPFCQSITGTALEMCTKK